MDFEDKIGSFSNGTTTFIVVKKGTKKTFEVFFGSKHASQKLLYSLHFSTYMKMVNRILFYGPMAMFFMQEGVRVLFTLIQILISK